MAFENKRAGPWLAWAVGLFLSGCHPRVAPPEPTVVPSAPAPPKQVNPQTRSFASRFARLTIGMDALAHWSPVRGRDTDWKPAASFPLASIRQGQTVLAATSAHHLGDLVRLSFDRTSTEVDVRITSFNDYLVLELAAVRGAEVDEIRFGEISAANLPRAGDMLTIRSSDAFAVCVMGLSDRVETRHSGADALGASVYRELGMEAAKVAILAVPTGDVLRVAHAVEHDFGLPSSMLEGSWTKDSHKVRRGYLFIDLTEANVDEVIRSAKLAGLRYIMPYDTTWSTSPGSYVVNTHSYPRGEAGLAATVAKAHAAGLEVGIHVLTGLLTKGDRLVQPRPDPRLLKDAETQLAENFDATATHFTATRPLSDLLPKMSTPGSDFQLDDEILHCADAAPVADRTSFSRCSRGHNGTIAALHVAGTKISRLLEVYGQYYMVDPRTSLIDEVSERIAGLIDRVGFDMVYFDGGEATAVMGHAWYWMSQLQMGVLGRTRRELMVLGSGITPWTWHVFAYGTSDDYSYLETKAYLDVHKIDFAWTMYSRSFLPAELGWVGLLDDGPDRSATTLDELELHAVRGIALASPISIETRVPVLQRAARSGEMLRLLGDYESLRLSGAVPLPLRQKLLSGEWHLVGEDGYRAFRPIRYDAHRALANSSLHVANSFDAQPLALRIRAMPVLSKAGARQNIMLFRGTAKQAIPSSDPAGPPALRVDFPPGKGKLLDLHDHRGLAVTVEVEGSPASAGPPAILDLQLESLGSKYRDHYIDLDFTGARTVIIPEPTTHRLITEFHADMGYSLKAAMRDFDYAAVAALNVRWKRVPPPGVSVHLRLVEALAEEHVPLVRPAFRVLDRAITLPVTLNEGDYAELGADGAIRVFSPNGAILASAAISARLPELQPGENTIAFRAASPGAAELTVITQGAAIPF